MNLGCLRINRFRNSIWKSKKPETSYPMASSLSASIIDGSR
jgi:hypothetical protein